MNIPPTLSILAIITGVSIGMHACVYDLLPMTIERGILMWILCIGGLFGLAYDFFNTNISDWRHDE